MFCNHCGKQIVDESKFCPYCGQQIVKGTRINQNLQDRERNNFHSKSLGSNKISAIDVIIIALNVILCVKWANILRLNYESTKNAFEIIDELTAGMLMYWIPFAIAVILSVSEILYLLRKKYYISIGVGMIVLAAILKMGAVVYNEMSFDSNELIYYRVFLVYSSVTTLTVILGIINTILLYYKKIKILEEDLEN